MRALRWFARQSAAGAAQYVGGSLLVAVAGGSYAYLKDQPAPIIAFAFIAALGLGLLVMPYLVPLLPRAETSERPAAATVDPVPPRALGIPAVSPPAPADAAPSERHFVNDAVTPYFLVHLFAGKTSAQATAIVDSYRGAWMRIAGTVRDVASDALGSRIVLELPQPTEARPRAPGVELGVQVYAYFDAEWRERIFRVPMSARVSVIGSIGRVSGLLGGSVTLDHCELVGDVSAEKAFQ
jgi:hypothetical protein